MTQLTDNVYAVEVPNDLSSRKPEYHFQPSVNDLMNERKGDSELIIYFERKTCGLPRMKITTSLPECGSYEFLFCAKGCSEDDARKAVERVGDGYKDYDTGKFHHDIPFPDAVNSLGSLLKAKGMDVKKNYALIQNL